MPRREREEVQGWKERALKGWEGGWVCGGLATGLAEN